MKRKLTDLAAILWRAACLPCAAAQPQETPSSSNSSADEKLPAAPGAEDGHYCIRKKRLWQAVAIVTVAVPLVGFLVAASGLMPIKASSGHWPITAWFLSFSMGRSVSTHSVGIKVPPLEEPGLILRGAGHYHIACRPCHGSPECMMPRTAQALTPHPPYLPPEIPKWSPAELFYIVRHGVKFTGMPAWPAEGRDDEVWAVTAFLLTLPDLDREEYEQLVSVDSSGGHSEQDPAEPDSAVSGQIQELARQHCADCHGIAGAGRGAGAFPSLAGQNEEYLNAAMQAYAQGARHSGIMETVATAIPEESFKQLARFYASQSNDRELKNRPPSDDSLPPGHQQQLTESIERGRQIAQQGLPEEKIPACISCHGPITHSLSGYHPVLAGQDAWFLKRQLELFHSDSRGGTERSHVMQPIARRLKPDQMQDVSAWYASRRSKPAAVPASPD